MKINISKFKVKQEFDRTEVFHWAILVFTIFGLFHEATHNGKWITFTFSTIALGGLFVLLLRLLKRLYYSFWTFTSVLGLFILVKLFQQPAMSMASLSYLIALGFLGVQAYTLWTPIFYPVVSWWEYDFRYRDELKVKLNYQDEESEARLTDLRRGAACISSFKELKLGETLTVEPFDELSSMTFKVEIMSKRQYSLGRPHHYGVKFIVDGHESRKMISNFEKYWKSERQLKQSKKFKNDDA